MKPEYIDHLIATIQKERERLSRTRGRGKRKALKRRIARYERSYLAELKRRSRTPKDRAQSKAVARAVISAFNPSKFHL